MMMFQKRLPAVILTLSLGLIALLLIVGWISQESELYRELLHFQRELRHYQDKCLRIDTQEKIEHKVCPLGFISLHSVCSQCSNDTFSLPHWTSCTKFLTCDDLIADIRPASLLWQTERWKYFLANWNSFRVVYVQMNHDMLTDSLGTDSTWKTATKLAPHPNLLYPVGSCAATNTMVYGVTEEIYPLTQLESFLERNKCNNWMVRFKLAIDYVQLLHYLHLHPSGPYVLCNSHSLDILLSQFAVSQHLELLLVNFENLPGGHQPVVCSREQLRGSFVAPEQNWPYSHYKMFNADEQPGYFHTSDIWKVPDITNYLLGSSRESEKILNYMVTIHRKCKSTDHMWRPSAREILTEYKSIWDSAVGDSASLDYIRDVVR